MNGIASRLLAALAYPRAIDDFVELALPLHSSREVRARIVSVERETHDVATLRLQPNRRLRAHRAGQHVALTASVGGVRRTRCFSIASAEGSADGTIELTIKAQPGGIVTPVLVSGALRGSVVTLGQPSGDFVLPDAVPERLLFVSGGSGITPVMSMLRTLLARGHEGDIVFLHWARSEADVIFQRELARIGREAGRGLRVHVSTGPFEPERLSALAPDFDRRETWACGPAPLLDIVRTTFRARGAEERLRVERFSLGSLPEASDAGAAESQVTFVRSQRRAKGGGPLLAMAEGAGLSPPSGCRMGICHTCVCRKVSGVTRDVRTGALSTDDDVDVQLCVSEPVGPVTLDL